MAYGPARVLPGEQIRITTNPDTEPFWQAAKEHKLTACQCGECGRFRMPPTAVCPDCGSREKNWPALPGTATVFSYVVCNKNPKTGEDYVYVPVVVDRSEEHTSELQSLMRISYAVFCFKKQKT